MIENDEIYSLCETHGSWSMSDFQARYFVVNSQVTDYRRVRQALLEIETRIAARKQIERNVKRTTIQKKIVEQNIAKETDPLQQDLLRVDVEQFDYDLSVYSKKYRVCLEEIEKFSEIVRDLVPDVTTLETYKVHDEEEERQYWITRMAKQATMDLVTTGRIGQGNLDSIAMMPLTDQVDTIKSALKYNTMLNAGIGKIEKIAMEELAGLPQSMLYIDEIVKAQPKIEARIKSEDI